MAHSKKPNRTTHPSLDAYKSAMAKWNKAHETKSSDSTTAKQRVDAKQKARDEARKKRNESNGNGKSQSKPYVDPDAADKKAEKIFRSSSSGDVAKKRHAEKDKLKITGKGPVASGTEYGKHLDARKKKMDAKEKAAWLKKTRNSPAAKAGFSDDERWSLQQKHRKWKADRKAGKLKKKPLTRAEKMKRRR